MNRTYSVGLCLLAATVAAGVASAAGTRPAADQELHVVSLYEGNYRTNGEIHGGRADVRVDRPGKVVTLVLSAYDPVTWAVTAAPESRIAKVVLADYKQQAVEGLAAGVEVVKAFGEGRAKGSAFYLPHDAESARFRDGVRAVHQFTGLEISSFQGAYRYEPGRPVVVSRVQDDPRLRSDYPTPMPAADVPRLEFQALLLTPKDVFQSEAAFGDFALTGPKTDSLRPVPGGVVRMAADAEGKKYYGLTAHELVEVDLDKQTTRKIDVGLEVPPLSWPSALALDTKRRRLVVASRAGARGYLYAYSPATGKWAALRELTPPTFVSALAYDPKEDVFYGLGDARFRGEGGGPWVLHRITPEGVFVKAVPLGGAVFAGALGDESRPGSVPPQLIAGDGRLVIVAVAGAHDSPPAERKSLLFLVDPATGEAKLTYKK